MGKGTARSSWVFRAFAIALLSPISCFWTTFYFPVEYKVRPTVFNIPARIMKNYSMTFAVAPIHGHKSNSSFVNMAIKSWISSSNHTKVIVFKDPVTNPNCSRGPKIETDQTNTPYVDDWILKTFDILDTDMVCFIMPDALLAPDFGRKVSLAFEYFEQRRMQFAVVGKRCQYDMVDAYKQLDGLSRVVNSAYSYDFIVLSNNQIDVNFDDIPPFHLVAGLWDIWLVNWLRKNIPVVSMGSECGSFSLPGPDTLEPLSHIAELTENAALTRRGAVCDWKMDSDFPFVIENGRLLNASSGRLTPVL